MSSEPTDAMVEAAYDAFTQSYGSKPIGTNNTRDDLRAALAVALSAQEEQIERYRKALERIARSNISDMDTLHPGQCAAVARAALEGNKFE